MVLLTVTEPVAVPFNWEHIPGKAKEDKEPEPQPREETSVTPRLPPGKPIDYVTKQLRKGSCRSKWD
ncbi:uncharacterized protein Pyn_14440 [Prunus yedoensis var. nudiflora]|uniref:Uncharacterized protein n=1 Tax=Prunus yedoensis var. nudiflora TaxID=2094558 RepID=A0A314XI84_PRUYE|nr:uncharacterized protein Pyn_14440 [Prunus yedoensis var. nudiflora]